MNVETAAATAMAAYLPLWLEDESLYSWCSRYHVTTPNSTRTTSLQLFGRPHAARRKTVPPKLAHFVAITRGCLGSEAEILRRRTAVGLHVAFAAAHDRQRLIAEGVASPSLLGLKFGELVGLRHCQECTARQLREHGVALWRVEHQLPGVTACLEHGLLLESARNVGQIWALPHVTACKHAAPATTHELHALLTVSDATRQMFQAEHIDVDALRLRASALLCESYAAVDVRHLEPERIQTDWAHSSLGSWAAREAPGLLCCGKTWITKLIRERHAGVARNPLKWAFLIAFLTERGTTDPTVFLSSAAKEPVQLEIWDDEGSVPGPVLDAFLHSTSFEEVAKTLGVASTTVRRWARVHPQLADASVAWGRRRDAGGASR